MLDFIFTAFELLKGKRMDNQTITTHKDGSKWQKVSPDKWVRVSDKKSKKAQEMDQWRKAQINFDYAMTSGAGNIIDEVLVENKISSFEDLVQKIKAGGQSTASDLYRSAVDKMRVANVPTGSRKDTIDNFGRSLITLKNTYSSAQKIKKTIKRKAKGSGKDWYGYEEGKHSNELPKLKATSIAAAKKKVGGWSITGTLLSGMVKKMITSKTAKLISGKINSKKAWVLPKKAEDMELKYTGNSLLIRVKQINKKAQRTRAISKVEIKIPYAYAKAFLLHQVKSDRTRNNFIFRMERSKGYRSFLDKGGA